MSDWKNDRAEMEMRRYEAAMMEEARKRRAAEMNPIGKWTITMKGNSKLTKEEIDEFMNKLIDFARTADINAPNLEVSIDPVIEDKV